MARAAASTSPPDGTDHGLISRPGGTVVYRLFFRSGAFCGIFDSNIWQTPIEYGPIVPAEPHVDCLANAGMLWAYAFM